MSSRVVLRDADPRSQLRVSRTEIAMAIDDPFPLLYGLADHDIITEQLFKETLERKRQVGIHKAIYSLLTGLLEREARVIRAFWANLSKDYNQERYPKLQALFASLPPDRSVSGSRHGKKAPGSSHRTHPQPQGQQGRKRSPEDRQPAQNPPRHGKRATSPGTKGKTVQKTDSAEMSRLSVGSGIQTVATSVQRALTLSSSELPVSCGTVEEILIQQVFESGSSKKCIKMDSEFYSPGALDDLAGRNKTKGVRTHVRHKGAPSTRMKEVPRNDDECAVCMDGGELICCDGCPKAYHLTCLEPPLTSIPSGTWRCQSCRGNQAGSGRTYTPAQCPGGEVVGGGRKCGVCRAGGELTFCPQCQQGFHPHCDFLSGTSWCRSCREAWSESCVHPEPEHTEMQVTVFENTAGQTGSFSEQILNKEELDSIVGESSIDGILQWALHNISRPLSENQGFFQ